MSVLANFLYTKSPALYARAVRCEKWVIVTDLDGTEETTTGADPSQVALTTTAQQVFLNISKKVSAVVCASARPVPVLQECWRFLIDRNSCPVILIGNDGCSLYDSRTGGTLNAVPCPPVADLSSSIQDAFRNAENTGFFRKRAKKALRGDPPIAR